MLVRKTGSLHKTKCQYQVMEFEVISLAGTQTFLFKTFMCLFERT